jgi:hypothetical protein
MASSKITSVCPQCGAEFTHYPSQPRRFCSDACYRMASRRPYLQRTAERLKQFTDAETCWPWPGHVNSYGYGVLWPSIAAHRAAWELSNGQIPDGLCVCHKCDNPPCCNPNHLFLGTHADNMADMANKGRQPKHRRVRPRPERQVAAKLTDAQVIEIRTSPETGRAAATRFNVSTSLVSLIRLGQRWKHLC